jgi:hypothetical protein
MLISHSSPQVQPSGNLVRRPAKLVAHHLGHWPELARHHRLVELGDPSTIWPSGRADPERTSMMSTAKYSDRCDRRRR